MARQDIRPVKFNWLLTCSDLFFLLVAFFVLNHALIIKNKSAKRPQEKPITEITKIYNTPIYGKSKFLYDYSKSGAVHSGIKSKELFYNVTKKWFSDDIALTPFGESRMAVVVNSIKNLSGRPEVFLKVPLKLKNSESEKLVHNLQNMLQVKTGKKAPVIIQSEKNIDDTEVQLIVRF